MDPQTLQIFAYIAATVGLGQFIYGVVLGRSKEQTKQPSFARLPTDQSKQLVSYILKGAGIGFMACAAVCYFANQYDWALMAGMGAFAIGSASGSFAALSAMKAGRSQ